MFKMVLRGWKDGAALLSKGIWERWRTGGSVGPSTLLYTLPPSGWVQFSENHVEAAAAAASGTGARE